MIELPEVIQNLRLHDTFDEAALKAKGSLVMRLNASSPGGCMVNKFRRYQLIIKIFWSWHPHCQYKLILWIAYLSVF